MLQGKNLSMRTAPAEPTTCGEGLRNVEFLKLLDSGIARRSSPSQTAS